MNYTIYINAKKTEAAEKQAISEYTKRLSSYCKTKLIYKPSDTLPIRTEPSKNIHTRYLQILPGMETPTSEGFADILNQYGVTGTSSIVFFIGYPVDTLVPVLSLSSMEISLGLTATLLCEQLYRSYRILNHQPYHK